MKAILTVEIARLTPILLQEIEYGFQEELKAGKRTPKGTKVIAMKFFSSIVHRSATRIMIGEELCRNEKFLKETASLLESIFFTAIIIVNLPLGPFRRPLLSILTRPHKRKLNQCSRMLQPVVESRLTARKAVANGRSLEFIDDAIEWTLDLSRGHPRYDTPEALTHELLHNLWAASSAPGGMMTEIVYQMLSYPDYVQPMRVEAEAAVAANGWTEKMLASLHLQDSFIREVNRMLPTGSSRSLETSTAI